MANSDRKSTRLNSSHANIFHLSLHDALPIYFPAHDWLRGPLRGFLTDTFADADARYSDFFNFKAIRTCIAAHLNRRANLGYHLWGLMMLFLWMKRWRIQIGRAHV